MRFRVKFEWGSEGKWTGRWGGRRDESENSESVKYQPENHAGKKKCVIYE